MAPEIHNRSPRQRSFAGQILKKIFIEDWGLKLTALLITLGLWFAVTGLSTPTRERKTVPLEFLVSSNEQITSSTQQDVQIDLSGDKRKLDQINRDELKVVKDLSSSAPGDLAITLSPDSVSIDLPQGVKLEDVQPSRIRVKLEAVAERDLEVKPQTIGEVVTGYEVYSISVFRPRIRVRGPASVVNALENVVTDKIDLAGRSEDFTARQVA